MSPSPSPAPRPTYEERRDRFSAEERRLARKSFRFSVVRGGFFVLFLAGLVWILLNARGAGWEQWAAAFAPFVVFLAILPAHDRVIAAQGRAADLRRLNEQGLARLDRDWDRLPLPSPPPVGEGSLARDLDLFGRASLFHLLGTAHSPTGRLALAGWLSEPAVPEEIVRRQGAVAELAPEVEMRQQLEVRTIGMEKSPADVEPFLRWAEGEPWLLRRPWLVWGARLMAVITVGTGFAALLGILPLWPFLLCFSTNLSLSHFLLGRLMSAFDQIASREKEFQAYGEAMARVAEAAFSSPWLRSRAEILRPEGEPAHRWMELLHRRLELSDIRHSALLHFPLQTLFLWDFHILELLERWQRRAGRHARGWLTALGEIEAVSALAGLAFDQPAWTFPEVVPGADRLAARELGHPLLSDAKRVSNDVEVGPAGTFLLVTGSNMSGKSTLLRSIGLNVVLAQAGGPASAGALRLPPVRLATSVLIEDSLAAGVSFFMAELLRIRQIVDQADRSRERGEVLLYLLDEILRGTNSRERQIAVRRVLLHLIRCGAIGAVSTHDLELADLDDLRAAVRTVHFRETLQNVPGEPAMVFDYRLRPGVATTSNALRLLEMVGIVSEDGEV
jgi:energy-coupling factor transporter ATP-binding protein EcfA2